MLTEKLADSKTGVVNIREQIDDQFFTPGPAREKTRPLILSVGLEQRDYRTLAAATETMDVDVAISAFSKDTKANQKHIPDPLPENMTMEFYPWTDLAQMYRDADLIVVPVFQNSYAAGITSILEGMAAARPVLALSLIHI